MHDFALTAASTLFPGAARAIALATAMEQDEVQLAAIMGDRNAARRASAAIVAHCMERARESRDTFEHTYRTRMRLELQERAAGRPGILEPGGLIERTRRDWGLR